MRYYVVSDPHGFFTELKTALEEKGFFSDPEPHKLILCGDLMDRGREALQLQEFVLKLMEEDRVILIRGNHEDLALELLQKWHMRSYLSPHHQSNGTVDTVCQLTGTKPTDLLWDDTAVCRRFLKTPLVQRIIPAMVDYFETEHYIFVHGWIPCQVDPRYQLTPDYGYQPDWREAGPMQWSAARWVNGMEAAHNGVTEPGKTVVCGHWHCSFGHANYEGKCAEFDRDADFSPYYAPGIIALDACTGYTGKINCIVLED